MINNGIFVTIEGIDGSGKTTQARFLKEYFENEGLDVVFTKEPGGTLLGKRIRKILLTEEMNPTSEFLLFASDRREHIQKLILPSLKAGKVVISDRFHDSSVAYQGYGRGVSLDFINYVHGEILGNLLPDITILVDVLPQIGLSRLRDIDRIEGAGLKFQEKVRNGYLKLAKQNQRFFIVNGTGTKKKVRDEIIRIVRDWRDNYEK